MREHRSAGWQYLFVAAFTLVLASCGGGGGSPTAPPMQGLTGNWSALEVLVRAEPVGQCWADHLISLAGAQARLNANITQSGNAVTVTINPSDPSTFTGTWDGTALMATEQAGGAPLNFQCTSGAGFMAQHVAGGALSVSGTTTRLTGTLVEIFDLTTAQGAAAGQMRVHYTIELTR